jgi:hypothetical protein
VTTIIHAFVRTAGAAAVTLCLGASALAQPASTAAPVARADTAGSIAWLSEQRDTPGILRVSRRHRNVRAAASAGWYWTDHLKSEIDFSVGRRGSDYRSEQIVINGLPAYVNTESEFSRRTLGLSQQYQFFRNAWFHPHLAAGAHITWERITERTQPVVVFDRPGPGRVIADEQVSGPRTDVTVRPFVAAGFKAYVLPRAFFRSDLRAGFRSGLDEVMVRFGFGIDF